MFDELNSFINYQTIEGPVKLVKVQVYHGANYFSAGSVVCLRINLGVYHEVYSNQIEGFFEKLKNKIPSLYEHHCSHGFKGGFFKRVQDGTLLGHIMEHVAIELQTMAGMDVGYGKTRSTPEKGTYNVIFKFYDEIAGTYAGKAAFNFINALVQNQDFNIDEVVKNLIQIREKRLLGPSTQAIVQEVEKRKIPFLRLDAYNLVQLGTGKYQKRVRATITSDTNFIAVETAGNKYLTTLILKDAGVPVLKTKLCTSADEVICFKNLLNKPIVIKPSEGYQGKNLSLNLFSDNQIKEAYHVAALYDQQVLAQEYIEGAYSFRLLVIDYKFVAATLLIPPYITGNGKDTIEELIKQLNCNNSRQIGDKGRLSIVEIDEITLQILKEKNFQLNSILSDGEKLCLKYSGNLRLGGSATDVTEQVHPLNKFIAERAARVIGLNVAGVDVLSPDISQPMYDNHAVVLEVNAAPDFRMHLNPTYNKPRNVAKELVNMLFPYNAKTRVPIFSITGTAGKTITTFILKYCLEKEGYQLGLTTTEGLYITEKKLMSGDMTEPESVALVLKDPTIDCAVLETSLEGIMRRGLGYKYADYGIVLNILDDHIGSDDVEFIDDIAYAKSVVAEEVFSTGYSILNADNEFTNEIYDRLYSKPALFSKNKNNNLLLNTHIQNGGLAVYLENEMIRVCYNKQCYDLITINEIPLFFQGKALFMSDVVLAVAATLTAFGMHPDKIFQALSSFKPTFENLPGRFNVFEKSNYTLIMDYAHNKPSFNAVKLFLSHYKNYKIGIFDAPGDRTDNEIIELGSIAATVFGEVVLYDGVDSRGRKNGEVCKLLQTGLVKAGFDNSKIHIAADHNDALSKINNYTNNNNLIVMFTAQCQICFNFLKNNKII